LESIFGTVEVARPGYRAAGTSSLNPLDGALNLPPEKYSLEVRRRVAMEAAKSSFDEGSQSSPRGLAGRFWCVQDVGLWTAPALLLASCSPVGSPPIRSTFFGSGMRLRLSR
jgi:hypothetical protein